MPDNEVKIKVVLEEELQKLGNLRQQVPSSSKDQEKIDKLMKEATLSLNNNDLVGFKKTFNKITDVLKNLIAASGKFTKDLADIDNKIKAAQARLDAATSNKFDLENKYLAKNAKGKYTLSKDYSEELFNANRGKIGTLKTDVTRSEVQTMWSDLMKEVMTNFGGNLTKITDAVAQKFGFNDRGAAYAANRYFKAGGIEATEESKKLADRAKYEADIKKETNTISSLQETLKKLPSAATLADQKLNEIYATLIKMGGHVAKGVGLSLAADQSTRMAARDAASKETPAVPVNKREPSMMGKAFKQFTLYTLAVRYARRALREAAQTIKELDKYLTEQAMVTGKTRQETYGLMKSYQALALQVGATTKEVAGVATEYLKQGKTINDALVLTKAAVSAAKVARVSVGDSVNYLTTALNGFRLSADQAMAVSDKFAAVAASSATDYDELAIALSKVASQANLAGMSIDYTTALLTKGLETTREAPETMGTALKTIIARMREMTDYGKTLEDGVDFNNVETQLSYVGIALKNEQGELRSTQDVLDELGRKWDTLNKNQQAALAKALAGTRQQSRLIAMMDGYERVIELQDIAERSAGATAAQAGTYLEGMEAAINKVRVAWEKVVTAVTNSELIIALLKGVANILESVSSLLDNNFILGLSITGVLSSIIVHFLRISEINKMNYRISQEEHKEKLKEYRLTLQKNLKDKENYKLALLQVKASRKLTIAKAEQALLDENKMNDATALGILGKEKIAQLTDEKVIDAELAQINKEIRADKAELAFTDIQIMQTDQQIMLSQAGIAGWLNQSLRFLTPILSIMTLIRLAHFGILKAQTLKIANDKIEIQGEKKKLSLAAKTMFAKVVGSNSNGPVSTVAAIATALALVTALGLTITAAVGAFNFKDPSEKAAENINKLSNDIYKLNEKTNALKEVKRKFEDIDKKVLKTSEDLKEMDQLVETAMDKLSEEEKNRVKQFSSAARRMQEIQAIEIENQNKLNEKYDEQLDYFQQLNQAEQKKLLTSTDAEQVNAQVAIRNQVTRSLYDNIDALKESSYWTEEATKTNLNFVKSLLDEMDMIQIGDLALNDNKLKQIINSSVNNDSLSIFMDENQTLIDRVKAYQDLDNALASNVQAHDAFMSAYHEWDMFSTLSEGALNFIDTTTLSIKQLNNLYVSYEKINKKLSKNGVHLDAKDYQDRMNNVLSQLNSDMSNFEEVLTYNFQDIIDITDKQGKNWLALVESIGEEFSIGVLDMGQNMDKFKSNTSKFYEVANKWNVMKENEKSKFISDNWNLFKGEKGNELLQALKSGNYDIIEETLKEMYSLDSTDDIYNEREKLLDEVTRTLNIENEKPFKEQNQAYIKQLEFYKNFLEDEEELFKISIKDRLQQQDNQLKEYKEFLDQKHKAEEKSWQDRKTAYQKYFNEMEKEEEDNDYDKKSKLLVSNISKLSSSTNADATNKRYELEQQFKELEEERLAQLRERAQEKIMSNIDTQIEEMNDKFDKLIESNQALLLAMKGDLKDPATFLANQLSSTITKGGTELELQSYLQSLQGIYGNVLGNDVFDKINVSHDNNNNLILNVNGQEIMLSDRDQQSIFTAIQQALKSIGLS